MDITDTEHLDEAQAQAAWDEEARLLEAGDASPADTLPATEPEQLPDVDTAGADGEPTGKTDEPAQTVETPADPYEGLPPAAAERLRAFERDNQSLLQLNQQLQHRVASSEGRFAAMQREFQARQASAAVPAHDAPTQTQIAAAAKSPEKWEKLKGEFPDWSEAVEEYLSTKLSGIGPQTPGIDPRVVAQFVHNQVAQTESRFGRRLEEARIEGKYPDWRDQVNTPEFSEWALAQGPEITQLAHSDKAADAIRMLDMYHEAKSRTASDIKQTRAGRLAAAATVRPGQTPPPRSLDDMSPEELWNYEARQREKRKGQ